MDTTQKPKLFAALVKAISETQDVHADATNPFHHSKYATLSAHLKVIKPIFAKHGLAIVQFPSSDMDSVGVTTTVIHESGESMEHRVCIPISEKYVQDKSGEWVRTREISGQQAGALISYLRRYALAAVAGCATDDDDAEIDRSSRAPVQSVSVSNVKGTGVFANPVQTASAPVSADGIDPSMTLPFGKNKGQPIGSLGFDDLKYWATSWEPKPFEKTGRVTAKDAKLKATAQALFAAANAAPSVTQDEVPF